MLGVPWEGWWVGPGAGAAASVFSMWWRARQCGVVVEQCGVRSSVGMREGPLMCAVLHQLPLNHDDPH